MNTETTATTRNIQRTQTSDYVLATVFAMVLHLGLVAALIILPLLNLFKPELIKVGDNAKVPTIAATIQNADLKEIQDIQREQQRREKIREEKLKKAEKQKLAALKKKQEIKKKKKPKIDKKKLEEKRKLAEKKRKLEDKRRKLREEKKLKEEELKKQEIKKAQEKLEKKRKLALKEKKEREEKRKREEKIRKEKEKKRKEELARKRKLERDIKRQRKKELERELAAERKAEAAAKAKAERTALAGASNAWYTAVSERIQRFWVEPSDIDPNVQCEVRMQITKSGTIVDHQVLSCTGGGEIFRRSVSAAFVAAKTVPTPRQPGVFRPDFKFIFKPKQNRP